jgi:ADP-dependent NAD(P)H-hydrate dehydratase / NAD(P)H-hydrate epimerase
MSAHLYRVADLRAIEQQAQASLAPGTLMARAGRAAADRIVSMQPSSRRGSFCVVCGPGNNGGDGFVIAAELGARGQEGICVLLGADRPAATDAGAAYERWLAAGGNVLKSPPAEGRFDTVIDALFGIGLARPLAGEFHAAADWINRRESVVAVDVPSGLDADTGAWVGDVPGIEATATVTFIGDKPGLHTAAGADAAGIVYVEAIGTQPPATEGILITPSDLAPMLRKRRRDSHKGTYGNVLIVGGGRGMVGAALLGGRAALRLGAGRVYVELLGAPEFRVDPMQPELMFRALTDLTDLQAVVVGCGLGTDAAARGRLLDVLACDTAAVIDADALNLIAADADLGENVRQRRAPTLLTPHPLEAARLLGCKASEVQADRVDAARQLARRYGAMALLKGAGSVIAAPDGRYAINPTGSPALATAGTGDVLAGMLGSFLAQGLGDWDAALAATWLHGRAAEDSGDAGLVAGEVAPRAADVLRRLRAGFSG